MAEPIFIILCVFIKIDVTDVRTNAIKLKHLIVNEILNFFLFIYILIIDELLFLES